MWSSFNVKRVICCQVMTIDLDFVSKITLQVQKFISDLVSSPIRLSPQTPLADQELKNTWLKLNSKLKSWVEKHLFLYTNASALNHDLLFSFMCLNPESPRHNKAQNLGQQEISIKCCRSCQD